MKRSTLFAIISLLIAAPSMLMAQSSFRENHAEVGVFADYLRFDPTTPKINFVGLGARLGVNIHPNIQLEGEMNYDFKRSYVTTLGAIPCTPSSCNLVTTRLRPLTALFGPKFQAGSSGPVRVFATGKIGFINFSTSTGNPTGGTVGNAISNIPYGDTHVAFYPGVGLEGFLGPVGLRLDVGDEIFFSHGTRNNLRVTFGPHFRF